MRRVYGILVGILLLAAGAVRGGDEWGLDAVGTEDFGAATAPAEVEKKPATPLPFWEIGLSEFEAETPMPIVVPKVSQHLGYYWCWPFSFRVVTNLEKVRRFIEKALPNMEPETQRLYEGQVERIQATLDKPLEARPFVVIHTDTGEIVPDTSNPVVRNLVERKLRRRLTTVAEIARTPLVSGQTIHAVAIFPALDPEAKILEIRIYGLGRRIAPKYQPGELLYLENPFNASVQRIIRYRYRRIGNTGDPALDVIELEDRDAVWTWIWPSQIYVSRFRSVVIDRGETLRREYRYIPYKVWNNTASLQMFEVIRAGVKIEVPWLGEMVEVPMLDEAGTRDVWRTLVMRQIQSRVQSGAEEEFVRENETARIDGVDVEKDVRAKSDILPDGENRHVNREIPPGAFAKGIIMLQWGMTDAEAVVRSIVTLLREKALLPPAEDDSDLLKAYRAIRAPAPADAPLWQRPAEPTLERVTALLNKLALAELEQRERLPDESVRRRYGKLAPVAHLLNLLASEAAEKRAEKGLIDAFFEVRLGGVIDRCAFPSHFQRVLPEPKAPFVAPEPVEMDLEERPTAPAAAEEWAAPVEEGAGAKEETGFGEEGGGEEFGEELPW